jgi:hypothetical protein
LIDALRLARGQVNRAAEILGVTRGTVGIWCRKHDVNPRDYRI